MHLTIAQDRPTDSTARPHTAAAVGGYDGAVVLDTTEIFDGSVWSTANSMPTARFEAAIGVLGSTLYGA